MTKTDVLMKAEAMLYLWSDGLTEKQLRESLQVTPVEWLAIEKQLMEKYGPDSGIVYEKHGETRLFATHPSLHTDLSELLQAQPKKSLSRQALEVLSIIAYKQPTTRLVVEQIRGVQSSGIFDTLLERGLIKEAGRLDTIGKPYIYETTDEFLRYFSLEDLSDLPPVDEMSVRDAD